MAGLLLRNIWLLYLRDNPVVELMILVAAIIYFYFVYFYIGQRFKEVNLAGIKNCLTLVVNVKSLKSITSR